MKGKHVSEHKKQSQHRVWSIIYVAFVMLVLSIPLLAIPCAPYDETAELQSLSEWPDGLTEGNVNINYLSEAGAYFEDHFAFRQQMMALNAKMYAQVFGVSTTDQAVVGTDGWLYYGGTMADYQRTNVLSERGADNAAYNLSLLQEHATGAGAEFVLAVAPNKNSIANEHMPYYEWEGEGAKSIDLLVSALERYDVNYVDLFEPLSVGADSMFLKTDTHWNTEGALVAYNSIMDALNKEHEDYRNAPAESGESTIGDIEAILYPTMGNAESDIRYSAAQEFQFKNDATAVTDAQIFTASERENTTDSLLMYRDSFGNALLPFFASEFESAYFSKLIPYNLANIEEVGATHVVVERAERHLDLFATDPPIMPAPVRDHVSIVRSLDSTSTMQVTENGPYIQVEGVVDQAFTPDGSKIFLVVEEGGNEPVWYEAFHRSVDEGGSLNDYGYILYLEASAIQSDNVKATLVVADGDQGSIVTSMDNIKENL